MIASCKVVTKNGNLVVAVFLSTLDWNKVLTHFPVGITGLYMQSDEEQIRQLVSTWMSATKTGDVETVLSLMSDDVVFLVTGQQPMRKADFERAAQSQIDADTPSFDGASEIQEIRILGDWAFMWQELTVVVTPPGGAGAVTRKGHTLTVFEKQNGQWVLARDANMLAPVPAGDE